METSVTSLSGVCITGFHSLELGFQQTCLLHKKKSKGKWVCPCASPFFFQAPCPKAVGQVPAARRGQYGKDKSTRHDTGILHQGEPL